MDLIEVRLGTDEQHFAYINPISIWLALPEGNGLTKLYLTFNMETAFPPLQLREDTPDQDLLLALFRWRMTDDIGATLMTPATFGDVMIACEHLVTFTARAGVDGGGRVRTFPIGVRGDMVNAITPAYNEAGESVGGHLVMKRVCMETDGRVLPVLETPDAILRALGWDKPTVTIGRTDRILTGAQRVIVPGKLQ
jgi:hypothetical protein